MRENKFKAWDKTKDRMSYPFSFGDCMDFGLGEGTAIRDGDKTFYLSWCEIMQYTGLKDKYGIDIYEGDIVEWTFIFKNDFGNPDKIDKSWYEVVYETDNPMHIAGFYFKDNNCKHNKYICFYDFKEVEIVGNIYENPELINNTP